jgi:hypothetical protein
MEPRPTDWKKFACDRIDSYLSGECDFDGLLMAFAIFSKVDADGLTHNVSPALRAAVDDFLAAAEPFTQGGSTPPNSAIARQLEALRDAIVCDPN